MYFTNVFTNVSEAHPFLSLVSVQLISAEFEFIYSLDPHTLTYARSVEVSVAMNWSVFGVSP